MQTVFDNNSKLAPSPGLPYVWLKSEVSQMIISASRRTDIPAFFANWFIERLNLGNFELANPFNPARTRTIKVAPATVEAIVFWTRYPLPLIKHLEQIEAMGYSYIFLITITGYPRFLEPKAPTQKKAIAAFQRLSDIIGNTKVIWRYDPIVYSSSTDEAYHLRNFENLARALSGHTCRVIISFLDFYRKLTPRFRYMQNEIGVEIIDVLKRHPDRAILLAGRLKGISAAYGMSIQSCAEETMLSDAGIAAGACIDSGYISKITGKELPYAKDKNQRAACLCAQSLDIGLYNSCRFNCRYCYASK
jgi:hypothetical protein